MEIAEFLEAHERSNKKSVPRRRKKRTSTQGHPLRRVTDVQELSGREGRARQISEKESWESRHRKERKERKRKRGRRGADAMNKKRTVITNACDMVWGRWLHDLGPELT